MTNIEEEIKDTVEEAREGFDLKALLQGRKFRSKTITLYTDEATGELLGDARDEDKTLLGQKVGSDRVRSGLLGRIDALDPEEDGDEIATLQARAAELRATLAESGITFELQSVPPLVTEAADRYARRTLSIKGKPTEDKQVDFNRASDIYLFSNVIKSVTLPSGETKPRLTPSEVGDLRDYLPQSEWLRLVIAVTEIQFKQAIGEAAVSDADF